MAHASRWSLMSSSPPHRSMSTSLEPASGRNRLPPALVAAVAADPLPSPTCGDHEARGLTAQPLPPCLARAVGRPSRHEPD
jgi:hypothetical protein